MMDNATKALGSLEISTKIPDGSFSTSEKFDFSRYFDQVAKDVINYVESEALRENYWNMKIPEVFDNCNQLIAQHIPEWTTLLSFSDGHICFHVYKMLYVVLKDPQFNELNNEEKNIILWATLLHDIAKRGKPVILGKDPIHPFRGGWTTLKVFRNNFKFVEIDDEAMEKWDEMFEDMYVSDDGELIQDHSKIKHVKEFLDRHVKEDFVKEVFWLILLHQSLPTIKDHVSRSMLKPLESEVKLYFTKRRMRLMGIILRNDSLSYMINGPDHIRDAYKKEIDCNVEFLMALLED